MDNTIEIVATSNTLHNEAFTIQDRIDFIIELDKKLIDIFKEIKDKKWDSLKDSRMIFFRNIAELNSNTILQLAFQAESYQKTKDKNWLKETLPHLVGQIDKLHDIEVYSLNRNNNISNQVWDTFILNYFYEFETRLRSIVRNIKKVNNVYSQKKNLNGNESFYLIYRGLFEDYLRLNKKDYDVLKIFAAIRNTIHNSGIYFSSNMESSSYNYRGKTYLFTYGKPVNFISSEFRKNILFDLLELWEKLLKNNKIININLINDPIADIQFTEKKVK